MATADEIIVRLTAQTDQLKAGMAEGAAVVKATQDEMAASMQTSMNAFREFDAIQKGSITTAEELAAAQSALQAAQASGAFTMEELAEKQALVAAAMKNIGSETQEASGMLSMFTRNSRTMYSTSALITDAMTGQFSRMRREVAALGNETGLMARAFKMAASPAGMIAMALAAIGAEAFQASQKINELNRAVLSGGGAAGMNGDQLETMAEGFKQMGYDINAARDALGALAKSGRVTQSDMQDAAQAALAYAQLTGESAEDLGKKFAALGTEGASGFIKLDETMHFLTNSQRENIAQLEKTGQTAQAVSVGYSALATHGMTAIQQLKDQGQAAEGLWSRLGTTIGNAFDSMNKGMGIGLTKQDELDRTNKLLAYYKQIGVTGEKINELTQRRVTLLAEIAQESHKAGAGGAAASSGIEADEKLLHGGMRRKGTHAGASDLETELRQEEADQKISYDKRQEFEVEYWGKILTTAKKGSAEYVTAWQHTQDLQKQIDQQQLASSTRTASERAMVARKAAMDAAQAEQMRVRAVRQADDEIVAEVKQEAAARRQAELTDADTVRQVGLAKIAAARQAARTEYDEGSISAGQLLQINNSLVQQKLALEVAYLRAKQQLDQGDINAEKQDAAQIVVVQQKADQERLANLSKFHQQAEQQWRQYTQRVQGMIASQVNAMLFQHQTLRNAVANVLESMTEDWITQGVKQLFSHQAVEAAKTAATVTGNTVRVAADTAGQAESLAVQGMSAIKWITTEAAKAAAGAFNAMVSIPYIGPFLAVGASIAAGAAVMALVGKVASAEGGWERVPADGMTTVLHRDEMVLPKHVADPVRNMARNGGGGGAPHFHFQSFAPRDFAAYLKRNPAALRAALAHAGRNGY